MLFWSPDQLPCLYCYPDAHLLRRRSRVNMHAPLDASRFPLFGRAAAAEALLEPGDVVFFPSRQVMAGLHLWQTWSSNGLCLPLCSFVCVAHTCTADAEACRWTFSTQLELKRRPCGCLCPPPQVGALHREPRLLGVRDLPLRGGGLSHVHLTASARPPVACNTCLPVATNVM